MALEEKATMKTPEILGVLSEQDALTKDLNQTLERLWEKLGPVINPGIDQTSEEIDKNYGTEIGRRILENNSSINKSIHSISNLINSIEL